MIILLSTRKMDFERTRSTKMTAHGKKIKKTQNTHYLYLEKNLPRTKVWVSLNQMILGDPLSLNQMILWRALRPAWRLRTSTSAKYNLVTPFHNWRLNHLDPNANGSHAERIHLRGHTLLSRKGDVMMVKKNMHFQPSPGFIVNENSYLLKGFPILVCAHAY